MTIGTQWVKVNSHRMSEESRAKTAQTSRTMQPAFKGVLREDAAKFAIDGAGVWFREAQVSGFPPAPSHTEHGASQLEVVWR